ncbi:MAG: M12 family metallopeptidase [Phycisphaerales bacterium]
MLRTASVATMLALAALSAPGVAAENLATDKHAPLTGMDFSIPKIQCSAELDEFEDRSLFNPNLWPSGNVYYNFNANVTAVNRAAMRHSMDMLQLVANITFIQRTTQTAYLNIQNSTGNNSQVGRTGGVQTVNIVNWNFSYVMCHELMHALGQWHEQSRPDRASFVNINYPNIQAGFEHNFDIVNALTIGTYDFDSVMHYDACGFSTCCPAGSTCACDPSCAAIQTLPGYEQFQSTMGQSTHLSVLDRAGLVNRYGARAAVLGPILADGTMDSLSVGTAPDYAVAAGAWSFPETYKLNTVAEPVGREPVFSIVNNSTFQPGGSGKSLHLSHLSDTTENFHLPNLFKKPMLTAPGLKITVALDMWTEGLAGGSIYVGGDNTAGGFSNASDRTAQISWLGGGVLAYADASGVNTPVVTNCPDGAWMNVRLVIDTFARNYDMYYGVSGGPQTKVGNDLPFRATTPSACWNYDRISFVLFGATTPNVSSYLDNVVVTSTICGADVNGDGYVDDSDFVAFAGAYDLLMCDDPAMLGGCPADLNGDGVVDDSDFVAFSSAYDALICPG